MNRTESISPLSTIAAPLQTIAIANRTFRIGIVDGQMQENARPFQLLLAYLGQKRLDPWGPSARNCHAVIACLMLREHAPKVTSEWLREMMTANDALAINREYFRQAVALAAAAGVAGRA